MIELKNLQKISAGHTVLDIPELVVGAGQVVALVGPAGSGKETLVDLLTGRTCPSLGSVRLAGIDPAQERQRFSQAVGVLFAEDAVYKNLSPLANLEFHCRLFGLPEARAGEVLAQVGLSDSARARIGKLPSGLLRRLALGRAILHDPTVLILVEPFARCDETTIHLLGEVMLAQAERRATLLVLASDQTHLHTLCDSIYFINQGRISAAAQPQAEPPSGLPFKIPVRLEEKVVLVNPADILYASAGEGRAFIVTREGQIQTQYTLAELEQRLARSGFFRAHRSVLVNLQHVREVIPYTRSSYTLRLSDPGATEIPLSKSAASELKELLGY